MRGAIFAAYWERDDASIQHYAGLRGIAESMGVDPGAVEAAAESDECRASLIGVPDGALARGVVGTPTRVIGTEIFRGKDRMDFVERELTRSCPERLVTDIRVRLTGRSGGARRSGAV